jgi:phage FluMu protein gp41
MENVIGQFKHGITIGGVVHTGFEMREADTEDMMEAEMEAARVGGGAHTPILFNAQMMLRQLVKVTTADGAEFAGPFTTNMLKKLKTADYRVLRAKQAELDELGEAG